MKRILFHRQVRVSARTAVALLVGCLSFGALTCGGAVETGIPTSSGTEQPIYSAPTQTTDSVFETERTAYGFFPTPPEASVESLLGHFEALGEHADFILIQPNVPWMEFVEGIDGESERRTDLRNQVALARTNGLEYVFVVDPLNGLNRREFFGLPEAWQASFANPDVRTAFSNFTLWIMAEFRPRYLGLASESNTYADAHPEDFSNYLSLYAQVYERVKAQRPETAVFVPFQWEDLNNMFPGVAEGRPARLTNCDLVEAFRGGE